MFGATVIALDRFIFYFNYNQAGRYCDNRNNGIDVHKGGFLCSKVHVTAALLCVWFSVFVRYSVVWECFLCTLGRRYAAVNSMRWGYSELITEYASDIYRL